jgi:pyruvate carboxylase subunit B
VEEGQDILILEAMKMEVRVQAPVRGRVTDILRAEGAAVSPGQHLMILDARS